MRSDFAAFILTHGRPDRVVTYNTLRKSGYTGRIFLVVDDEDKTFPEYKDRYGAEVVQFSKSEASAEFDEGDNFGDRRAIFYARNSCWSIAKRLGIRWFIQLDDDYVSFRFRFRRDLTPNPGTSPVQNMNRVLESLIDFQILVGSITTCISQGGDWIGGAEGVPTPRLRRKAMNSFICDAESDLRFVGRVNEDVNTYTSLGRRGALFLTVMQVSLDQKQTQTNAGGMTEMYLDSGTYVKSFYSVMYAPSCVKVSAMSDNREGGHSRFHHDIDWPRTVPCILREEYRKGGGRW